MTSSIISCDLHDYVELACMHNYRVQLTLKDRQVVTGKAMDIVTAEHREYLVVGEGDQQQKIDLTHLAKLEVLTPNAKFSEVEFKDKDLQDRDLQAGM